MSKFRGNAVIAVAAADAFGELNAGHESEKLGVEASDVNPVHARVKIEDPSDRSNLGGEHPVILGQQQGSLAFNTKLVSHGVLTYTDGVTPTSSHGLAKLFANMLGLAPRLLSGSKVVLGSTSTLIEQELEDSEYEAGDIIAVEDALTGVVETGFVRSVAAKVCTLGLALPNGAPATDDHILGGIVCKWQEALEYDINAEAVYEDDSLGAQYLGVQAVGSMGAVAWNGIPIIAWALISASFNDLDDNVAAQKPPSSVMPFVAGDGYFAIGVVGDESARFPLTRLNISIDWGTLVNGCENPGDPDALFSGFLRVASAIRVGITCDPDFNPPGSETNFLEKFRSAVRSGRQIQAHFQFGRGRGQVVSYALPGALIQDVNPHAVGPDGSMMYEITLAPDHDLVEALPPLVIAFH